MKNIVQLVDTIDYVRSNCFQHQLEIALDQKCNLIQVELKDILYAPSSPADGFISCLKQRTLMRNSEAVGKWLKGASLVVYDQDPWQSFMDDSPFKGAYHHIMQHVNVKSFALTTQWWVDYLASVGMPSTFVKMGVLSRYCVQRPEYLERKNTVGFVGSVHPRRKMLLDAIESSGIKTSVLASNSLAYPEFLEKLSELRIFVHNEDMLIYVDGKELNFNTGMWVKDVEAASQGCFSIRSKAQGSETYLEGLNSVILYDNIEQVPDIIREIESMNATKRQSIIDHAVAQITEEDAWSGTARKLIELASL